MTACHATTATLARLAPLARLEAESLKQVASLALIEKFPRSRLPVGFDWARKVVFLLTGELKVVFPDGRTKVFVGGCDDALFPLFDSRTTPLSATPITDVQLLWFDENALDILFTWDQLTMPVPTKNEGAASAPPNWRSLPGIFDARHLTRGTFASLPAAHIESLLDSFRRQPVVAGEVIVRQSDPGTRYYVIERGRAQVTREVAGAQIELAELDSGDTFGEEALIAGMPRNATVTMKTAGELLCLDAADFARLLRAPLLRGTDVQHARARVASGAAVWLDVRFPAEYKFDGLREAINIPLNELRDTLPSLRNDREYIVYCQSGRRSSAATFLLSQRGFQAALLDGGLKSMQLPERKVA